MKDIVVKLLSKRIVKNYNPRKTIKLFKRNYRYVNLSRKLKKRTINGRSHGAENRRLKHSVVAPSLDLATFVQSDSNSSNIYFLADIKILPSSFF